MGWLLVRKHPEVRAKGAKLDLADLYADPLLRFQRRQDKSGKQRVEI
jgi:stearoyl-CoA desaturase (Delta-9 desaturase)